MTKPKRKFAEMNWLDKRLFSVGMYLVAIAMVLFNPDIANRGVLALLHERLDK